MFSCLWMAGRPGKQLHRTDRDALPAADARDWARHRERLGNRSCLVPENVAVRLSGSPAVLGSRPVRPLTLRPALSRGLPFSDSGSMLIHRVREVRRLYRSIRGCRDFRPIRRCARADGAAAIGNARAAAPCRRPRRPSAGDADRRGALVVGGVAGDHLDGVACRPSPCWCSSCRRAWRPSRWPWRRCRCRSSAGCQQRRRCRRRWR